MQSRMVPMYYGGSWVASGCDSDENDIQGKIKAVPMRKTRCCLLRMRISIGHFEGIEDNTDRIQTREEVDYAQSAGKTLADALKTAGVSRVDVVGIAESHCVKDTALDARKLGFEVTVFEDLTVPVSEELGVAARKQMTAAGIALVESR